MFLTIICSVIISYHLIFIPFAFYNSLMCDLEGKWYKIIVIIHLLLLLNRIKVALLIANLILFFLELTSLTWFMSTSSLNRFSLSIATTTAQQPQQQTVAMETCCAHIPALQDGTVTPSGVTIERLQKVVSGDTCWRIEANKMCLVNCHVL